MSGVELKRFALFAELDAADAGLVEDLLDVRELETGEVIVTEGEEADGLLLLKSGALAMSSARISELRGMRPGDFMGGLSLASLGRREVTLKAAEPSTVLLLTRSGFLRLSEDAPRAATRLLEAVLRDLGVHLRTGLDDLF